MIITSRQLYMFGFLLLVAGGFLHISGFMSRSIEWWEYWGEFMFFIGLFVGVLGVVIPEKKTKTISMALVISFFATFAFAFIWAAIDRLLWYPYSAPLTFTITTIAFLHMIIKLVV